MKKKLKTSLVIDAYWGSEFQKESGEKCVKIMLEAWKTFYENQNKKNVIIINDMLNSNDCL